MVGENKILRHMKIAWTVNVGVHKQLLEHGTCVSVSRLLSLHGGSGEELWQRSAGLRRAFLSGPGQKKLASPAKRSGLGCEDSVRIRDVTEEGKRVKRGAFWGLQRWISKFRPRLFLAEDRNVFVFCFCSVWLLICTVKSATEVYGFR